MSVLYSNQINSKNGLSLVGGGGTQTDAPVLNCYSYKQNGSSYITIYNSTSNNVIPVANWSNIVPPYSISISLGGNSQFTIPKSGKWTCTLNVNFNTYSGGSINVGGYFKSVLRVTTATTGIYADIEQSCQSSAFSVSHCIHFTGWFQQGDTLQPLFNCYNAIGSQTSDTVRISPLYMNFTLLV
jgi:hypothetical protein